MQQLNAYRFYELGAKLHALFGAGPQGGAPGRVADLFAALTEAQNLLDGFIKGQVFALDTSRADAVKLLEKIGSVFSRHYIDPATKQLKQADGEDRIDPHELALIATLVEKFEHALASELNRAPTYVADKRGIYSTYDLAENAQQVFSDATRAIIPTAAQLEFNAAGRALAFGLGTAASIHMLRAVEVVLKPYFEAFAGSGATKGERNYTIYLKKLIALSDDEERSEKQRPDRRVIQMLAQIKDHYRNPLITPETTVSLDEGAQLFGMSSALISLMAEQIEARRKLDTKKALPAASSIIDEDDGEGDFRLSQSA